MAMQAAPGVQGPPPSDHRGAFPWFLETKSAEGLEKCQASGSLPTASWDLGPAFPRSLVTFLLDPSIPNQLGTFRGGPRASATSNTSWSGRVPGWVDPSD